MDRHSIGKVKLKMDSIGGYDSYEYKYRLLVDEAIIDRYSGFKVRDDIKFLYEMRTKFIFNTDGYAEEVIDTERFEMGSEDSDPNSMALIFRPRLADYGVSHDEILKLVTHAASIAAATDKVLNIAAAALPFIPIAIEMDVCTLRKPYETEADARDRAIVSRKLFPLFLMNNRNAFDGVAKSPHRKLSLFLRGTEIYLTRVTGREMDRRAVELGFGYCFESMYKDKCYVCREVPKVGEQIAILVAFCGHAFHYHCLISSMVERTSCPRCSYSLSAAVEEFPLFQDENSMAKFNQI